MLLDIRAMVSDPPELIERFKRGIKFDIYLDGKLIPYSFFADTAEGLVKAYAPDPHGQLRVCTDHTCIGEYELRGKVEIKRRPTLGVRAPGDTVVKGPEGPDAEIAGVKTKRYTVFDMSNLNLKIAEGFRLLEFACPCCSEVSVDFRLLEGLVDLRRRLGKEITIGHGYWCEKLVDANGVPAERIHCTGTAADIGVYGLPPIDVLRAAEQCKWFNGFGLGRRHLHVDVRSRREYWHYNGKQAVVVTRERLIQIAESEYGRVECF